jgi:hypothetical protein
MQWINAKETPPDPKQEKILAFGGTGGGYVFECEWEDGFWVNMGGDEFSHWMPYPPIPSDV